MLDFLQKIIFLQSNFCDFILSPIDSASPLWQLLWLAALTGVLMVTLYWLFSNQPAIKEIKNKIKLHFLEIRLYKNDINETVSTQKRLFRANFQYIWLVLKPGTILVFFVFFILVQLHARFSFEPLKNEICISIAMLAPASRDDVKILLPKGVKQDSPLVFIPAKSEFNWRIRFGEDGMYKIGFRLKNGETVSKRLIVGRRVAPISPARTRSAWSSIIEYPAAKFLPDDSGVKKISTRFPEREITLITGKSYNWILIFFPAALLFGLLFKTIMGIE